MSTLLTLSTCPSGVANPAHAPPDYVLRDGKVNLLTCKGKSGEQGQGGFLPMTIILLGKNRILNGMKVRPSKNQSRTGWIFGCGSATVVSFFSFRTGPFQRT